jgi:GT2 family glycosyltransferase
MPDISLALVVCTSGRPGTIARLLSSLARQTCSPREVLVVDGSVDDDTQRAVEALWPSWPPATLRYLRVPAEHRGLTRQRNYGLARTTSEIVAFLDDDTIPEPGYFSAILACFARHADAAGVGGYIVEADWARVDESDRRRLDLFVLDDWARRDDFRWRLRRLLGLESERPPGWMPRFGHARPVSFLPPDGSDHQVEFIMGGASAWRRAVFDHHAFSRYFDGYGLYEDLEFCLRVSRQSRLYLCTSAKLAHYHERAARPDAFRYGKMVVQNGWYVWRRRWPSPGVGDRVRWWATTMLLALCRVGDAVRGPDRLGALTEALGRGWGMLSLPSGSAR